MNVLQQAMDQCGPWLYAVLAGSIIVLSIVVERAVMFLVRWGVQVPVFLAVIEKLVVANNIDRALKVVRVLGPRAPVGRVVLAGLEHADEGPERAQLSIDEALAAVRPWLRSRLLLLLVVGLATFAVGALGSYHLGGFHPLPGSPTPLPFRQPLTMAPFMAGTLVGAVATLASLGFFVRARRIEQQLTLARLTLLRLLTDRAARRDREAPRPAEAAAPDGLPRLGNLGLPPGSGSDGSPGR